MRWIFTRRWTTGQHSRAQIEETAREKLGHALNEPDDDLISEGLASGLSHGTDKRYGLTEDSL